MFANIILLICILNALRVLYNNGVTLKQLTMVQWGKVLALYGATVALLVVVMYYGVNSITAYFDSYYVRLGVFLVAVVAVFALVEKPFKKLRTRATDGLVK